jgi:hypothetical protein
LNSTISNYPLYIVVATKLVNSFDPGPEPSEKIIRASWFSKSALDGAIRSGRMFDAASLAAWKYYEAWRRR